MSINDPVEVKVPDIDNVVTPLIAPPIIDIVPSNDKVPELVMSFPSIVISSTIREVIPETAPTKVTDWLDPIVKANALLVYIVNASVVSKLGFDDGATADGQGRIEITPKDVWKEVYIV